MKKQEEAAAKKRAAADAQKKPEAEKKGSQPQDTEMKDVDGAETVKPDSVEEPSK